MYRNKPINKKKKPFKMKRKNKKYIQLKMMNASIGAPNKLA